MARKANLLNVALRMSRAMAADQRRAQNAAIMQHNAEVRFQNAMARESEREFKKAERERLVQEKENAIQYAIDKTSEAEKKRTELISIIRSSKKTPTLIDWNSFKELEPFSKVAPQRVKSQNLPKEIDESTYNPRFGLLDKIFKSRRENAISAAKEQLSQAIRTRSDMIEEIRLESDKHQRNYETKLAAWTTEKEEFERHQEAHNKSADKLLESFDRGEQEAVEFHFDAVLQHLDLPEDLELQWQIQYDPEAQILIVDFDLPEKDIIPSLKLMKYVVTRKEFSETQLKDKDLDQIYDELLLQLCLRVTNDIYVSDVKDQLKSVVFNGIYYGVSKSTGKEETKCIMSLQTEKEKFLDISIENVDAKTCFLKFKGVAGNKLSEFVPIAPLITMDREDSRFVENIDVSGMINGMNLAAMCWESFEHLIRELFAKEFATNGAEVRITQASRDGGVDAVMFDPDPIRGGKYVIQAKRYTNVVGVSAVRDLYGTLMNEGAVKGILVTTANYGADSYEFAKDKPITLINGNNLLHMLQKHGYQARIDLEEAKKLMTEEKP
jgi:restriction system protein